jgi:hypothetical protein
VTTGCDVAEAHVLARCARANSFRLVLPSSTAPARCEPLHDDGVRGRDALLEETRADRGADAGGIDAILAGVRDAVQRTAIMASRELSIRTAARSSAASAVTVKECVGFRLQCVNPIERWRAQSVTQVAPAFAQRLRRLFHRLHGYGRTAGVSSFIPRARHIR